MFIAFTVAFAPLISAKAVRESIVQTVIEWKDEFASIFFKSENEPAVINEVNIGYMVEGFEFVESFSPDNYTYKTTFVNGEKFININIYSEYLSTIEHNDNEFSNYYTISIDDKNGIWLYREDYSVLLISNNKFIYSIYGNIDIGKLIEIYKNIEIF